MKFKKQIVQNTSFEVFWKCQGNFSGLKCLKKRINWIISKTYHSIWKIIFVLGTDEYLERLVGKMRKYLFFYANTLGSEMFAQGGLFMK